MRQTPLNERYLLSIREAADYFGIGEKKLRRLAENNLYHGFAVYNGNRYMIIRKKLEEFLESAESI
ncbi:helix-turn-helix domain-containing protein [Selenomonas bovis]|uniref:Helix-turn-helix domain-containing protein n=1 Tax=Selenomonas bovis TaxID=416586 RepID=A0A848BFV4_9FIRM|nr:helix-turn-helix domain-containing protein [Selenomonas sp.]NMD99881.1 helix-turn-helix domain-containing protein [Selenomonas bovis]